MIDANSNESPFKRLGMVRRKAFGVSEHGLVRTEHLPGDKKLPLVVKPVVKGVGLVEWAKGNREFVEKNLSEFGGILFRGFNVGGVGEFQGFARAVSDTDLLEYRERSSPRSQVADNVYTSTDYPADQPIFLHNENSYQHTWPLKIFFFCVMAAERGGETPIADVRRIFERIDPEVRRRFVEKKWMYVRNFDDRFGLPWQTVFQTDDRQVVEDYCRRNHIIAEWRDGDRLRTRAVREVAAKHPRTGEDVWFNHATFFHVTTLEPTIRDAFLLEFKDEDLPNNTYYGDGTPIEPEVLDALRAAYRAETVAFPWQEGDILMLDNMLAAHGRAPYAGQRKILVAMTEPLSREGLN
jgi:alpha-ketoglutarate-dependent taurine dioxygenase